MKSPTVQFVNSLTHRYRNPIMLCCVFIMILLDGCDSQQNQGLQKGILTGTVTIGPLCPVETVPPDPNCQPTEDTYKAWPIGVFTIDNKTKLGLIQPNLDGTYSFELPEGAYVVDLETQNLFGSTLPATIKIIPQDTTVLDIDIDTGIR